MDHSIHVAAPSLMIIPGVEGVRMAQSIITGTTFRRRASFIAPALICCLAQIEPTGQIGLHCAAIGERGQGLSPLVLRQLRRSAHTNTASWLALKSRRIRICSDLRPATVSPTKERTPGSCRRTSATGTSQTPCATRNSQRAASRTSGKIEQTARLSTRWACLPTESTSAVEAMACCAGLGFTV
jgi:hypothetical protein